MSGGGELESGVSRVLVTGASGFVGSAVASALAQEYQVVTVGRSACGYSEHVDWDACQDVPQMAGDFKYAVHCAGHAHVRPRTAVDRERFFEVNVAGTRRLLQGLERLEGTPEALILFSTVAVYGLESGLDVTEEHRLSAADAYGQSKIQAEGVALDWGKRFNIPVLVLRLPLVVGRDAPGNLGSMVKAVSRRRFFLIGKGDALRSMVLLDDVASQIGAMLGQQGIFNLTDGRGATYRELAHLIATYRKVRFPPKLPNAVARFMGTSFDVLSQLLGRQMPFGTTTYHKLVSNLTFSSEKAKRELGWSPTEIVVCPESWLGTSSGKRSKEGDSL